MKVYKSQEKPPIYDECVARFGADWDRGTIFTYGDTIHCKYKISKAKEVHERVHVKQQLDFGVENWWFRYFEYPEFRLQEELAAYQAEVAYVKKFEHNLKEKMRLLHNIAVDFSSPLYGNLMTFEEAKQLLQI